MGRLVGVTDKGCRVGQDHPRAKLTNADIDLLLQMRDDGMSYGRLAEIFEAPKASVACWCKATRRNTAPTAFRQAPD